MPLMETPFHCSNGHSFTANAKLRTRCPECGVSTKRSFEKVIDKVVEAVKPDPVVETKPKIGPVLVKQGRPRMPASPVKKTVDSHKKLVSKPIGAKVLSAGLVKSHTIKRRGVMPTITKRPVKTAIARGIHAGHEVIRPYWHDVADKMGF
jgi:hypothetical protein